MLPPRSSDYPRSTDFRRIRTYTTLPSLYAAAPKISVGEGLDPPAEFHTQNRIPPWGLINRASATHDTCPKLPPDGGFDLHFRLWRK